MHAIGDRAERFDAIARAYVNHPEGTLVVSPDNASRIEINCTIHHAMQAAGHVDAREHRVRVLVARQDVTGADRQWAEQYARGDVIRYTRGSETLGLEAGAYARVAHVNAKENLLTVARPDGEPVTYDPRRVQGVTLYREADRALATGDRVQFTAPDRERHVANGELGTIETMEEGGQTRVRLDSGRHIAVAAGEPHHLDHGYAVTSHSSQGQTADRVLVHVDTDRTAAPLVNQRLAYVAISRGRYDAEVYTNDVSRLVDALGRDVSHRSALEVRTTSTSPSPMERREPGPTQRRSLDQALAPTSDP